MFKTSIIFLHHSLCGPALGGSLGGEHSPAEPSPGQPSPAATDLVTQVGMARVPGPRQQALLLGEDQVPYESTFMCLL